MQSNESPPPPYSSSDLPPTSTRNRDRTALLQVESERDRSRPQALFAVQMRRELGWLWEARANGHRHDIPSEEEASSNVKKKWFTWGIWDDEWGETPGEKWKHEAPVSQGNEVETQASRPFYMFVRMLTDEVRRHITIRNCSGEEAFEELKQLWTKEEIWKHPWLPGQMWKHELPLEEQVLERQRVLESHIDGSSESASPTSPLHPAVFGDRQSSISHDHVPLPLASAQSNRQSASESLRDPRAATESVPSRVRSSRVSKATSRQRPTRPTRSSGVLSSSMRRRITAPKEVATSAVSTDTGADQPVALNRRSTRLRNATNTPASTVTGQSGRRKPRKS